MSWSIFIIRKSCESLVILFVDNVELNSRTGKERLTSKSQIPALNVINGNVDILSVNERKYTYES